MTEENTQGIVLKLIDYKDANKLASIFSLHHGITTAKFTGIKKEKAKLKAVAQPFVLADFTFSKTGSNKTVTGANMIDNFYQILANYNKTICGYIVLDVVKTLLPENQPEQDLFLITVASLKNIETQNEYVATIDFLLKFLNFSGMGIEVPETDYVFLDKSTGDFTTTRNLYSVEIDKKVYSTLKLVANNPDLCLSIKIPQNTQENFKNQTLTDDQDGNKLISNIQQQDVSQIKENISKTTVENITETTLKQVIRLLGNIIYIRFNSEIKTIHFV